MRLSFIVFIIATLLFILFANFLTVTSANRIEEKLDTSVIMKSGDMAYHVGYYSVIMSAEFQKGEKAALKKLGLSEKAIRKDK